MSDVVDRRDRRTISLGLVARATNLRGRVIPPDDQSILWKRVPDQVPPVVDVRQLEDVGTFLPLKDNVVWYIDDREPIRGVSAKAEILWTFLRRTPLCDPRMLCRPSPPHPSGFHPL